MRTLITERELDKMEVAAEVMVSEMEEEFDDAFMGSRKKKEVVEEVVDGSTRNATGEERQDAGGVQQGDNLSQTPIGGI